MSNADLIRRHLSNYGIDRAQQDSGLYTGDVVTEFPYAPPDHTRRLDGPEPLLAFQSRISSFAEGFSLGAVTIIGEGSPFVARYHGSATFTDTGLPYEQDYVVVVETRDGKISRIEEHYDPMRVLRAMGEIP